MRLPFSFLLFYLQKFIIHIPRIHKKKNAKLLRMLIINRARKMQYIKAYAFQKYIIAIQRQKLVAFHLHDSKLLESLVVNSNHIQRPKKTEDTYKMRVLARIVGWKEMRNKVGAKYHYLMKWKEHRMQTDIFFLISQLNVINSAVLDSIQKESAIKEAIKAIKEKSKSRIFK